MHIQNFQQQKGTLLTVNQKRLFAWRSKKAFKKSIESSLCDCSDVHILVTGNVTVTITIAATGNDKNSQK